MLYKLMNKSGMTIMGTVVSLAVMGIALTSMMKMVQVSQNSSNAKRAQLELSDLNEEVAIYFKNSAFCDNYFANQTFNPTDSNASIGNLSIAHPNDSSRVIASNGTKLGGGAVISAVSVHDFVPINSGRYAAKVSLSARAPSGLPITRSKTIVFDTTNVSASQQRINNCVVPTENVMTMNCPTGEAITGINFESQEVICTAVSDGGDDGGGPPARECSVTSGMGRTCCASGYTIESGWCSSEFGSGVVGNCFDCDGGDFPGRAHANCCRPAT